MGTAGMVICKDYDIGMAKISTNDVGSRFSFFIYVYSVLQVSPTVHFGTVHPMHTAYTPSSKHVFRIALVDLHSIHHIQYAYIIHESLLYSYFVVVLEYQVSWNSNENVIIAGTYSTSTGTLILDYGASTVDVLHVRYQVPGTVPSTSAAQICQQSTFRALGTRYHVQYFVGSRYTVEAYFSKVKSMRCIR